MKKILVARQAGAGTVWDWQPDYEGEIRMLREALKNLLVPYVDAKKRGLPSGVYVQRFRFEAAELALKGESDS